MQTPLLRWAGPPVALFQPVGAGRHIIGQQQGQIGKRAEVSSQLQNRTRLG